MEWRGHVDIIILTAPQAHIYEREHNDQQAYLLLMRYATLVVEKLGNHKGVVTVKKDSKKKYTDKQLADIEEHNRLAKQNLKAFAPVASTVSAVFERLEALKPSIEARYSSWQQNSERRREAAAAGPVHSRTQSQMDLAALDPAVAGNTMTLAAAENSELAVKMAHNEIRRRRATRRLTEEEQQRRAAGVWEDYNWEAHSKDDSTSSQQDDQMRLDMEASRRRTDGPHDILPDAIRQRPSRPPRPVRPDQQRNSRSEYHYPSIPKSQPPKYDENPYEASTRSRSPRRAPLPPKPPKERLEQPVSTPAPPLYPEKPRKELPSAASTSAPPSFTFRPSAYLENGSPLRTVFLPPTLRQKFLDHVKPNTQKNLETCGMLCGTLISNALFISKVVIPEQNSTSDTCDTENEGALFDYCATEDLMVLGWIHTHPTQTCFMSSRDLHTHAGYQVMMPESIAIVCAPSKTPS